MGRAYYLDQINQSPWDYLGSLVSSWAPSEIASQIAGKLSNEATGAAVGVAVDHLCDWLGLVNECYDNEHITEWTFKILEIEKETEELLRYKGDTDGGSGVKTYNSYFAA